MVHDDPAIRRVLFGPGKEGACLAQRTEGVLIERVKHGFLTGLCFYVLSNVAGVMSGRRVFIALPSHAPFLQKHSVAELFCVVVQFLHSLNAVGTYV